MAIMTRRIVPSSAVVCADLNDEAVLLNVDSGIYFGVDAVGAQIWKLIEAGAEHNEIVDGLLAEYEVSRAQLDADVSEFVARLAEYGLIEADQA